MGLYFNRRGDFLFMIILLSTTMLWGERSGQAVPGRPFRFFSPLPSWLAINGVGCFLTINRVGCFGTTLDFFLFTLSQGGD